MFEKAIKTWNLSILILLQRCLYITAFFKFYSLRTMQKSFVIFYFTTSLWEMFEFVVKTSKIYRSFYCYRKINTYRFQNCLIDAKKFRKVWRQYNGIVFYWCFSIKFGLLPFLYFCFHAFSFSLLWKYQWFG